MCRFAATEFYFTFTASFFLRNNLAMNDTVFLHVETNLNDDSGFPTAISWSLPDTRIKSVLIIPDDDWLDTYYESRNATKTNLDNHYHQGASCIDIARELHRDLDGNTIYVINESEQSRRLEMLFDSAQIDIPFEILPATDLFHQTTDEVQDTVEHTMAERGLEKTDDHIVLALLLMAREHQLL